MSDPTSTVVSRVINAPREAVYRAFPIDLAPVGAIFQTASAPAAAATLGSLAARSSFGQRPIF